MNKKSDPQYVLPITTKIKIATGLQVLKFLSDPHMGMQQKIDGRRLILVKNKAKLQAFNKAQDEIEIPEFLIPFAEKLPAAPWTIDGEIKDKQYHIFDLVNGPDPSVRGKNYAARLMAMRMLVDAMGFSNIFTMITWIDPSEKLAHILRLREGGAEGVVFRPVTGETAHSVMNRAYKHKFYKSVDAVVIQKTIDGRRVCEIGVLDGHRIFDEKSTTDETRSSLVSIGKVKIEYEVIKKMKVDQVVEVRYRSFSKSGRLIEPVFLRLRDDKKAYRCTMDQLVDNTVWVEKDLLTRQTFEDIGADYDTVLRMITEDKANA